MGASSIVQGGIKKKANLRENVEWRSLSTMPFEEKVKAAFAYLSTQYDYIAPKSKADSPVCARVFLFTLPSDCFLLPSFMLVALLASSLHPFGVAGSYYHERKGDSRWLRLVRGVCAAVVSIIFTTILHLSPLNPPLLRLPSPSLPPPLLRAMTFEHYPSTCSSLLF